MTASKVVPIVRAAEQGERLWFYGGGLHTWKATAAETGGTFLLFEDVMSRGKTTPLHTHPKVDETLYMLEGEILLHIDGDEQRIGAGGVAMAPRGCLTLSLSHQKWRGFSSWKPQAPVRSSTEAPASQPQAPWKHWLPSTSPVCERRRSETVGSRSSDRLRSRRLRTGSDEQLRKAVSR